MNDVLFDASVAAWVIGVAWVIFAAIHWLAGWSWRRAIGGSLSRLAWVSASLGALAILPLGMWTATQVSGHSDKGHDVVALVATVLALGYGLLFLQPPVRLRGTRDQLPRVEDEAFLARVAELSQRMGIAVPMVRLWPSLSGSQQALAFAGTLQAPQLVVTDGILRRLSPAERDAIVAHELAHIANGSLWMMAAIMPVSGALATAASAFLPLPVAAPLALLVLVGARRLVSRPIELDCDLRAARVVGFRDTASALAKIHSMHPLPNTGLLSLLTYATATHPSREVRLMSLCKAAPEGDRPEVGAAAQISRRQRRASAAAFVVWALSVGGTLAAARFVRDPGFLATPLWLAALAPTLLLLLAQRKRVALGRSRLGQRAWPRVVGLAGAGAFFAWLYFGGPDWLNDIVGAACVVFFVALVVIAIWKNRVSNLRHKVLLAMQVHDFSRAVQLAEAAPPGVARDPLLRYNAALARAVCGDRERAITDLERLWEEKSRMTLAAQLLSLLLLDADRPESCVRVAQSAAARAPRDPVPALLEARALCRMGRLEEAQIACDRGGALAAGDGTNLGIEARIALDRAARSSDVSAAAKLIDRALERAPGDCYALLVHAEVSLRTQPLEAARSIVEQALESVRSNRLVFLAPEVARLERALHEQPTEAE